MCSVPKLCVTSLFDHLAVMTRTGDERPAKVQTNLKELFKKPRSSVLQNVLCTLLCTMLFVLSKEPISKFSLIYLFQCISLCRWGYESQPLVRVEYLLTLGLNFIGWVQWVSGNFFHLTNFHIAREVLKCTSEAL